MNLMVIEQRFPVLYQGMQSVIQSSMNKGLIPTKEEGKALIIEKDSVLYRMNSSYRPLSEANTWADQFSFSNIDKTTILFGLGNGIFANVLLNRLEENEPLIIYEPSFELFQYILHEEDFTTLFGDFRVAVIIPDINEYEFSNLLQAYMDWRNINSRLVCLHPQYDKLFQESYKRYLTIIRDTDIVIMKNANTDAKFGKSIVINTMNNLPFLMKSRFITEFIEDEDKDIPVFIVSAGPSLAKNVNVLKQAKGRSMIIAVDRALDYLLDHGVEPDFVITMDPWLQQTRFSKREEIRIPVLCSVSAADKIMQMHKGEKILVHYNGYVKQMLQNVNIPTPDYNPGGSVSNAAFYVCAILKTKRVILVGQDLAYDGEVTHLGGEKDDNIHDMDTMWVEDIHGNPIQTRRDWYTYLEWFQNAIELKKDMEVIDATEGGAKIKGSIIMSLQKVVDTYCNNTVDCREVINRALPCLNDEGRKACVKYYEETLSDLVKMKEDAADGIRSCNNLLIEYRKKLKNEKTCFNYIKKLQKINDSLINKPVYELIDYYIKEETMKDMNTVYQNNNKEQEDIRFYKNLLKTYQLMSTATDVLITRFQRLIRRVNIIL
jgi:hypothetical protein